MGNIGQTNGPADRLKDKMAGLTFKIGSFIARTANLAKTQPEVLKRCISTTAVKFSSPYDHPLKPEKYHEGKFFSDDVEVANEMALAVGKERYELLAAEYGDDDPWGNKPIPGKGTFDDPTLIPSMFENRVVGEVYPGSDAVSYFTLWRGEPKRSESGHWYKLVTPEPKPYADI